MNDKLRKLQLTQLEILKVIDLFCKENDIQYSLYAGTLLGAVRHKGFIPWDDDLDICMSRKNYNLFIKKWNERHPKGYLLQNKKTSPEFSQSFSKIRKEHTTFWQEGEPNDSYHTGIFVDIFPIDYSPDTKIKQKIFQLYCVLYQLYTREYPPLCGSLIEKSISKLLLNAIPKSKYKSVRERLEKKITSYDNAGSSRVIAIETLSTIRKPMPSVLLEDYTYLQFEDGMFMCFAKWDEYLKIKFGDYMKLPPISERTWKHMPLCLDFERDYNEIK